jgi:hypothetical protein
MSLKHLIYSRLASYGQHSSDNTFVTPSSKVKTECISLCVLGSIFSHKATNSEINSITSVYYNVSLIQNLLQDQEVYTAEQNTTLHVEDRGLAHLEEVFIKKFFIF